jgi:hypothetical protein
MKLNSSIAGALALGAALLVGTAFAGSKFTGNGSVVIARKADGSGQATGMLGHIYNAPTLNEFIACQKSVTGNLYCQARNEANVHVACTTNSAYLANAVGALATDARVTFRWNASGLCTAISISRSSEFQDKQG